MPYWGFVSVGSLVAFAGYGRGLWLSPPCPGSGLIVLFGLNFGGCWFGSGCWSSSIILVVSFGCLSPGCGPLFLFCLSQDVGFILIGCL